MSNSAHTGDSAGGASAAPSPLPHWRTFAQSHDWGRAEAAASLAHVHPDLLSALATLASLQRDIRARHYAGATRALKNYTQTLPLLVPEDGATLAELAPPEALASALAALDHSERLAEPDLLTERLAPAFAAALTRAEAHNSVGILHALREESAEARAQFEAALAHDGGHYRARMNLGNLALESGDPKQAEAHYREVIELAPDYDGVHHNLGVALRRQGKVSQSVGAIRKAQRLGTQRLRQQNKEEAEAQLREQPRLRLARTIVIVLVLLLALWLVLGRGG